MTEAAIKLRERKESIFIDKVQQLLPEGGNLNLCLTCGRGTHPTSEDHRFPGS